MQHQGGAGLLNPGIEKTVVITEQAHSDRARDFRQHGRAVVAPYRPLACANSWKRTSQLRTKPPGLGAAEFVQCRLEAAGELLGRAGSPVMQKIDSRLPAGHVVVDGHHV